MIMNKKQERDYYISKWKLYNNKLREVNKYLYENTELFENYSKQYLHYFDDDLHNFFAKKITRFSKEENELNRLLGYILDKKFGTMEE